MPNLNDPEFDDSRDHPGYRARRAKMGFQGGATKTEAVPAEESRLILRALADADWSGRAFAPLSPQGVFLRLGLTEKDGWKPPADLRNFPAAAQKWLKENAGKYRVRRYVPAKERK